MSDKGKTYQEMAELMFVAMARLEKEELAKQERMMEAFAPLIARLKALTKEEIMAVWEKDSDDR